jgi:hypothetical protein
VVDPAADSVACDDWEEVLLDVLDVVVAVVVVAFNNDDDDDHVAAAAATDDKRSDKSMPSSALCINAADDVVVAVAELLRTAPKNTCRDNASKARHREKNKRKRFRSG